MHAETNQIPNTHVLHTSHFLKSILQLKGKKSGTMKKIQHVNKALQEAQPNCSK